MIYQNSHLLCFKKEELKLLDVVALLENIPNAQL